MRARVLGAILGLVAVTPGCIGGAQHRGEPLPGWPPPAGAKPLAVNLVTVLAQPDLAKRIGSTADLEGGMKKGVHRALEECPGIRLSDGPAQPWDRRVVVSTLTKRKDEGKTAATILLFACTGMLFPVVTTFDIQLTARIYDGDGEDMGVFFQRGDHTEYTSPFFLFVFLVWPVSQSYEDECYELTRRFLLDARGAGVL